MANPTRTAVEEVVTLEEGKYRLIRYKNGALSALRHGEPWRDLTGDKLVGALLDRLLDAEAHLREIGRVPPGCEFPFKRGAVRVCAEKDAACAEIPRSLRCRGCPENG